MVPAGQVFSRLSSSWRGSWMAVGGDQRRQMDEPTDSVRHDTMLQVIKVEAIARSEVIWTGKEPNKLPVLLRVTAPARKTHRIGVDVVAVLDVSENMKGERLEYTKQAMEVVINKLSMDDRLSIVSFETGVNRLTQLTSMSDQGQADARATVKELVAGGSTNMRTALLEGDQILWYRAPESTNSRVGCMMFLSDGDDKEIYKKILSNVFPAYTFGLGADHNPKAMKHIADETHGTYSFVSKDISNITKAFALFIAGLTSVAATSVDITLTAHEGTAISAIESGGYLSTNVVDNCSNAVIKIPDMYAGEEKNFIVHLMVTGEGKESLMTVGGKYQILGRSIELVSTEVTVPRARGGSPGEEVVEINPKVAAELTRVELMSGIWVMVNEQNDEGQPNPITSDGLQDLWDGIKGSDDARATLDVDLSKLENDVAEMKTRIDEDYKSGLAYVLSWLSCHWWQRAATKDAPSDTDDVVNMTGERTSSRWRRLLFFLVPLLVVALLVMAVMRYSGGAEVDAYGSDHETTVVDLEQKETHMVQITKLEEQLRQKETQLVRMTELEELKAKQVTRIGELELELQYKEKLVVRTAEVERALLQKETVVVSLRSELKQQLESCAQRAAKVQVELKICSQMAEKWKVMVVKILGRYIDDEDYYEQQRTSGYGRTWLEC